MNKQELKKEWRNYFGTTPVKISESSIDRLYQFLEQSGLITGIVKPKYFSTDDMPHKKYICNICESITIHSFHKYCPQCGSKIDWQDKE